MTMQNPIPFDNTFVSLPDYFYSRQTPSRVSTPQAIRMNSELAELLNIDLNWFACESAVEVLAGNRLLPGSDPIAMAYAGHQFGAWNPQLGDGRAILLGEVVGRDGQRYDIQLKGAGRTPYSRMGDGLAPLGPVLREYLVSEAMAALGVPTTRSLAAVATGDRVARERLLPGAVLTRVARSHIRVGQFQYFAWRDDWESVKRLADYVIQRDFPSIREASNPYVSLLDQAIQRQASLIAQWQLIGFIHGVMNTDNMLICGDTIDYGPCAFMDEFNPEACFSSIDHGGRYAYKNQPIIAQWNLAWFAQSLLPLFSDNEKEAVSIAQELLADFNHQFEHYYQSGLLRKLGLPKHNDAALSFAYELLDTMAQENLDFTLTFRHLADISCHNASPQPRVDYCLPVSVKPLLKQWRQWLPVDGNALAQTQKQMHRINPACIPRNHIIEKVINAAQNNGDLKPFHRLMDELADPFHHSAGNEDLIRPPEDHERVLRTFCGT